jgi:hypothetical protein
MTTGQSQQITFFIDRCLGSKGIVTDLRSSGIAIEIHDDHFAKDAIDVDWLPEVDQRKWVILTGGNAEETSAYSTPVLTKDARIGRNHLERMAVTNAGIKMFTLASQNLSGRDMADIFLESITKMQEFVRKHPAPFIAKVYRDGRVEMWKDAQTLLDESKSL